MASIETYEISSVDVRRRGRAVPFVRRALLGTLACTCALAATFAGGLLLALLLGALPPLSPVPLAPSPFGSALTATAVGPGTVRIAVISNGFHSDIALPADGATLEALGLDASHYPVERGRVSWWAVGWGSREAYTSLVAVADLTPGLVARAVAFDETVMHVLPTGPLPAGEGVWFLDLPAERYDALVADMAGWFAHAEPEPGVSQGFGDRFYEARGRFTAWYGCNAWVGARLRAAGVPVGAWTPAAQSLAYGLDRLDQSDRFGGAQE